jgi:hypothetical protein
MYCSCLHAPITMLPPPCSRLHAPGSMLPDARFDAMNVESSLQSPLLTLYAHRLLILCARMEEVSAILELTSTLLFGSVSLSVAERSLAGTYHTAKTLSMPLSAEGLDNNVGNRLPTLLTLSRIAAGVTIHTPCIAVLLHEGCRSVKRLRVS